MTKRCRVYCQADGLMNVDTHVEPKSESKRDQRDIQTLKRGDLLFAEKGLYPHQRIKSTMKRYHQLPTSRYAGEFYRHHL